MTKLYVFDLDGTLANIDHRLRWINKKPKDWKSFLASVDKDIPNQWVVNLLNMCSQDGVILILTGREEITRRSTMDWLRDNGVFYDYLSMRAKGDHRQDTVVKPEVLDNFLRDKGYDVQFIVEDRQQVVDKWRELGYNVLQCDKWEEYSLRGKA